MKTYLADTNFYLRFLLQDNKAQALQTETLLKKAKKGDISIAILSEVLLEMTYVLESYYKVPRIDTARYMGTLVKTDYLDVENRSIWIEAFELYVEKSVSIFDLYLLLRAKESGSELLTYDKNLKKLYALHLHK